MFANRIGQGAKTLIPIEVILCEFPICTYGWVTDCLISGIHIINTDVSCYWILHGILEPKGPVTYHQVCA